MREAMMLVSALSEANDRTVAKIFCYFFTQLKINSV